MNDLDCTLVRQRLEDLLDGYLSATDSAAVELHLARCRGCTAERAAIESLRGELQALPVPEPSPGFAAAALAAAARSNVQAAATERGFQAWPAGRWAPRRRLELWMGAALGAAATAVFMALLSGVAQREPPPGIEVPSGIRLALHEVREIGVAIDVDAAVSGAVMTVLVQGGVDLVGFGEQREISWRTDLDAGTNMLSLPIIAHSMEGGRLTALLRHGDTTRRVDLSVSVAPPAVN